VKVNTTSNIELMRGNNSQYQRLGEEKYWKDVQVQVCVGMLSHL